MEDVRTSLFALLAGLTGGIAGAAMLGCAAIWIGMSLLKHAPGGIHSDWTPVVLLAILVCAVTGGVVGAKAANRFVKSRS
jgi:hypothetical protein